MQAYENFSEIIRVHRRTCKKNLMKTGVELEGNEHGKANFP